MSRIRDLLIKAILITVNYAHLKTRGGLQIGNAAPDLQPSEGQPTIRNTNKDYW